MEEQNNTQQPQPPIQYMMIPVMMPAPLPPKPVEENKTETPNIIVGMFWAAVILLMMWFITGGWEVIR